MKTTKTMIAASLILMMGASGMLSARAQSAQPSADRGQASERALITNRTSSYEGMWQGTLHTSGGMQRVTLDVGRRNTDNNLIANVITAVQTPYSVLVNTFRAEDNHVRLEMKTSGCVFEGTSNHALTEIQGTWMQNGKSLPLTLKRVDTPTRSERGTGYGTQDQTAGTLRDPGPANNNDSPSDPVRQRHQPAFRFGPPRWFAWREWSPWIGNQEVPYGTNYW